MGCVSSCLRRKTGPEEQFSSWAKGMSFLFTPCSSTFFSPPSQVITFAVMRILLQTGSPRGSLGAICNLLIKPVEGTALSSQLCVCPTVGARGPLSCGAPSWSPSQPSFPLHRCLQDSVTFSVRWRRERGLLDGAVTRIKRGVACLALPNPVPISRKCLVLCVCMCVFMFLNSAAGNPFLSAAVDTYTCAEACTHT